METTASRKTLLQLLPNWRPATLQCEVESIVGAWTLFGYDIKLMQVDFNPTSIMHYQSECYLLHDDFLVPYTMVNAF